MVRLTPGLIEFARRAAAFMERRRLLLTLLFPVALVLIGTLGYYFIEDKYTLFDALYMTVITLATIGYEEPEEDRDQFSTWS